MTKERRLLLIDNSVGDFYKAAERFYSYGFSMPCDTIKPFSCDELQDVSSYTHIISTGCTKCICEIEPWMLRLEKLFQDALDKNIALLGICFSHQLLARAAAGEAYARRRAVPELGWVEQELLCDDPLLGKRGDKLWGFVSHFDEVSPELPKDKAEILMRSETCAVEAFRIKGKNAWGIQAHFEESIESGREMLKNECSAAPWLEAHIQNGASPRDGDLWPKLLTRFEDVSAN